MKLSTAQAWGPSSNGEASHIYPTLPPVKIQEVDFCDCFSTDRGWIRLTDNPAKCSAGTNLYQDQGNAKSGWERPRATGWACAFLRGGAHPKGGRRAVRNRERRPDLQPAESTAHGLSTAVLILAWGWYVLTRTILFIKSKSTKSALHCRRGGASLHHVVDEKRPQ